MTEPPEWWPEGARLNKSCTGPCQTCTQLFWQAVAYQIHKRADWQHISADGEHYEIDRFAEGGTAD